MLTKLTNGLFINSNDIQMLEKDVHETIVFFRGGNTVRISLDINKVNEILVSKELELLSASVNKDSIDMILANQIRALSDSPKEEI